MQTEEFREVVEEYYRKHGRDLPWRQVEVDGSYDPYKILVSEMMLQQTQVARVIPKYHEFLERFPKIEMLAKAPLGAVLKVWSGLGYNRRAKFLWQTAKIVASEHRGQIPRAVEELVALPGVGHNTAGAIMAYAYNQPVVFIETNIRTIFIHHFFFDQEKVSDKQIAPILEQTLNRENPREFYWALMDYGSYLKTSFGNISRQSQAYAKQSRFAGSKRQMRGQVVRFLTESSRSSQQLRELIDDVRLHEVLESLENEGLVRLENGSYCLA